MSTQLRIETRAGESVHDITDALDGLLADKPDGFCLIGIPHTTAALTVLTNEQHVANDMLNLLKALIPHDIEFQHSNPRHVMAHVFSAAIGVSVVLPVRDGRLKLGEFQRLVLMEFEGPKSRVVEVFDV